MEKFGIDIWWDDEDLASALDQMGIPPTEENVEKLAGIMNDDKIKEQFEEKQIEAGWDFLYSIINERMMV